MLKLLLLLLFCVKILTSESPSNQDVAQDTAQFWTDNIKALKQHLPQKHNKNVAKNIIFFLGGGNAQLENFPHVAIAKANCLDSQLPDPACTSTAYLGGVKVKTGTIGATENANIAQWAQAKGKRTGLVTSGKITGASTVALYSHRSHHSKANTDQDRVLANQLIKSDVGRKVNVILGHGRDAFLPKTSQNQDNSSDGVNLIETWLEMKKNDKASYVANQQQLLDLDGGSDFVLGLFGDEMSPDLAEMTQAAIKSLELSSEGYFLLVDASATEIAHNGAMLNLGTDATADFAKAVQSAVALTSEQDTLIVVVSKHHLELNGDIICALGPWSHLFSGVIDNSLVPFIMGYASCLIDDISACNRHKPVLHLPLPSIF